MTHVIVSRGVEKGIEKASRIMMPALFVILLVMAVRVAFMPGAADGYRFFLSCDFGEAFKIDTIMMAVRSVEETVILMDKLNELILK